jgi:hypothetical protein
MDRLTKYKTFKDLKNDKASLDPPLSLQLVNEEFKEFMLLLRKGMKPKSKTNIPPSDKFVSR